jgi:hypothetical protein
MPQKPSVPRVCVYCGKEFLARPGSVRRGNAKYCGRSCRGKATAAKSLVFGNAARGSNNPNWRGGLTKSSKGYWYVYQPDHPGAVNGYVKRATLVLEEKLGRYLQDGELAHHENEDKEDDSPDNLVLEHTSDHSKLHSRKRVRKPKPPRVRKPDSPYNRRYQWPGDAALLEMRRTVSLREMAKVIGCTHKAVDRRLKKMAT